MIFNIVFIIFCILIFWSVITRIIFLRKQVQKEIFLEETPITVIFETDNYTSKCFTLDDMDEIQDWLYKEAQLGKACTVKIVLEENAGYHKDSDL